MNALANLPAVSLFTSYKGYTLYTTYEPCFMCAATIIGTYGIPRVAFAAYDPHLGRHARCVPPIPRRCRPAP